MLFRSPLADQQIAGGMMMSLDTIIVMVALTLYFWRAAADFDRAEARAASRDQPLGASTTSDP